MELHAVAGWITGVFENSRTIETLQWDEQALGNVGEGESEGFDAPDEAGGPGFLGGERRTPEGENLRALVDAFETFLGFGDRFDRRNPKIFDEGRVQGDANALPAVFHAQDGAGHGTTEAKVFLAERRFKKAVGFRGGKKIDDRFDADGHGLFEKFLKLQSDFASHFEAVAGGAERKLLEEQEFGCGGLVLAKQRQAIRAEEFGFVRGGVFHGESAAGETGVFA